MGARKAAIDIPLGAAKLRVQGLDLRHPFHVLLLPPLVLPIHALDCREQTSVLPQRFQAPRFAQFARIL
jgi:hypothetical protein